MLHSPSETGRVPYAPKDLAEWTEFHYRVYDIIELLFGNRQEELPEDDISRRVNEAVARGESFIDILNEENDDEDLFESLGLFTDDDQEAFHKEAFG